MTNSTRSHLRLAETKPHIMCEISLPPRFDVHAVDWLLNEITTSLEDGSLSAVVIDGSRVKHADLAGLEALAVARRQVESAWTRFQVVPSTTIEVVCELTGSDLLDPARTHSSATAVAA